MDEDRRTNGNSVFSTVVGTVILSGACAVAILSLLKSPMIQAHFREAMQMSNNISGLATAEFKIALTDADILLGYATKSGLLASDERDSRQSNLSTIIQPIVVALRAEQNNELTDNIIISFWEAYAELSKTTSPVSAESIRDSKRYSFVMTKLIAATLVITTILFSIFLFMSNATAIDTNDLIEEQNSAALKLWSDLQILKAGENSSQVQQSTKLPQDLTVRAGAAVAERVFAETVEFSRKNNWLLQSASKLRFWFNLPWIEVSVDSVVFNEKNKEKITTLNVSPDLNTEANIREEVYKQIKAYQIIRDRAIGLYKNNTIFYGGISTYLLPTVYALLGAYLYSFRHYSEMINDKIYLYSQAYSARYFIAAIGGLVIGLFGSLLSRNLSLPPLAIAFLIGYAVEALFSPLDAYIAKITVSQGIPKPQPPYVRQVAA